MARVEKYAKVDDDLGRGKKERKFGKNSLVGTSQSNKHEKEQKLKRERVSLRSHRT